MKRVKADQRKRRLTAILDWIRKLVPFFIAATILEYGRAPAARAQVEAPAKPRFELLHLWLSPIERPALDYLRQVVTREAGVEWQEHRVEGNFYGVRDALAKRLALNVPPTATFWIGGQEVAYMTEKQLFRTITRDLVSEPLDDTLWPELVSSLRGPEGYAALPLVIHLQNITLFNRSVFQRLSLPIPSDWNQFLAIAPTLQAAGVTPIAVSDERWQMRFLFQAILAEGLSIKRFETLLDAREELEDNQAVVQKAFEVLLALKRFANADAADMPWNKLVRRIDAGQAALMITGDFAAPAVKDSATMACRLAIGADVVFWSYDVLALPVPTTPQDKTGQERALRALTHEKTLLEFGRRKGGLPVVKNVMADQLDACSANSLLNWSARSHYELSTDRWRLQLNLLASLSSMFWKSEAPDPATAARQLLSELRALQLASP